MTLTVAPTDPTLLRDRFDAALAAFLRERRPGRSDDGSLVVHAVLRQFVLAGGKRLRPLFCYWGWRGSGGLDGPPIVVAAAALELFHAFALIHDDILDGSDRRRGQPSVHRIFADLHARSGWHGDPEAYGRDAALLCGDLCAAWSGQMFHGCGLDQERIRRGYALFARMRAEVIAGEYLDVVGAAGAGSVADALTVIRLKTARYTVTRPVQIGAVLAGADPDVVAALADFGDPLGEAFQLRDDLLGVFGDPAVTGKSNLDDLREGKSTVLLALARAEAGPGRAARLRALVGDPGLDQTGAAEVRGIIEATGARERVEGMIRARVEEARAALDRLPLVEPARSALAELTVRAAHRRH
ncbi:MULTISPECIES: polyprenyl synthetase family protein [Micromonospora]|uniref:Polyprenyl synthetase family protein n=1 Tax=Micromonospora solifontis TaxID=2487138 RepID=A0ABX9WE55_9ACTN|nr:MULTISPECIES: polyprenyl synthetase family protein [Micromonospora]NES16584.1 polyprenyl synthetase family protein [Micromonospora sp. PPF5-17B]NES38386.1 polyprenyl synthetase family protein [Micromonospora solifontis]NES58363.1 polyprenyl synthetase family protein [Micromonospora sp. PPF5-6]RNL95858.1 polyprenyl synthetase family protein [Micromonospora solifontis]